METAGHGMGTEGLGFTYWSLIGNGKENQSRSYCSGGTVGF